MKPYYEIAEREIGVSGDVLDQVYLDLTSDRYLDLNSDLKIERRDKAPDEGPRVLRRQRPATAFCAVPGEPGLHFYSIGDFYEEIVRGLDYLYERLGKKMYSGDPKRQATSEYYYSGGGELFPVTCHDSAVRAAKLIIGQGEGFGGGIYDKENELAHYYRFQQLLEGKYYQAGDKPDKPTGPPLKVDWAAVYPIKKDARLSDYAGSSELHAAAAAFNKSYADILAFLTSAFSGKPQLLLEAVPRMFRLRDRMTQLIHVPIPGMVGVNATPTFEVG